MVKAWVYALYLGLVGLASLVQLNESSDFKLSDSKILLPFYSIAPLNFTLQGSDSSCYKWSSGAPEVVTVTPVINDTIKTDCSREVVVSAVWKSPHRATTTVFAENKYTGHIIKCDVIVDKIYRLEITTTTHELFLHDAPEALIIKAYDEFGNTFSSLEGIPFEWRIFPAIGGSRTSDASQVEGHQILRFISYTESEYATPAHIGELEAQGMQGYMQLVSGLKTGSARVGVSVKPSIYAGVSPGEVKLLVMANSVLSPALVYAIPLSQVKYHVHVVQQGNVIEIDMPSPQYYLELNSSQGDVGSLEPESATVTALKLGVAEVTLHDRNIQEEFRKPSSLLHVVEPGYLMFFVSPGKRWVLETGRQYVVTVQIFDYNSHRIHPSDNLRLKVTFPAKYFRVLSSTLNGTQHLVETLLDGSTSLRGELATLETPDGKVHTLPTAVVGTQEVEIYKPIQVIPPLVVLPDHPNLRKPGSSGDRFQLRAVGGSGEYLWAVPSEGNKVVSVNARGELTVQGRGHSDVFASDVRNAENRGRGDVYVTPVASLVFLLSRVEVEIGSNEEWLMLPLSARDAKGRAMQHCHLLPIVVGVEDASVLTVEKTVFANPNTSSLACALVRVKGRKVGFTEVTAHYDFVDRRDPLVARVMVGAFHPLRYLPQFHSRHVAVASVGSVLTVSLNGGPQPWILNPARYFAHLKSETSRDPLADIAAAGKGRSGPGGHLTFHVKCLRLGKVTLVASVGNEKTSKNTFPVVATAEIDLVCSIPAVLHLVPLLHLPKETLPPCPIVNDTTQERPIHNDRKLEVDLIVVDAEGHRFDQCSSLDIRLSSSDTRILLVPVLVTYTKQTESPTTIRFMANPIGPLGAVSVSARTAGYLSSARPHGKAFPEVRAELFLKTVQNTQVTPAHLKLFDHGDSTARATIDHGSGHFVINPPPTSRSALVGIKIQQTGRRLQVFVAKTKELENEDHEVIFNIYDLCLESPAATGPPRLHVSVQSLKQIHLIYIDKLQLGKEARFSAQALDHSGVPIPAQYFSKMRLKPVLVASESSHKISVVSLGHLDSDNTLYLTVKGIALGFDRLVVQGIGKNGEVINSNEGLVQVYPPLTLVPDDVTLLKGASYQLQTKGGPQPLGAIDFVPITHKPSGSTSRGSKVSRVGRAGLVTGLAEGLTEVEARASGGSVATGRVRVIVLSGVRVHAPLTVVETGSLLPVWAMGAGGNAESPISMGSLKPAFEFHWSLSSEQVARLEHVLAPAGVAVEKTEQSSGMRLIAISPGEVTIRLRVVPTDRSAGQVVEGALLSAQLNVKIISPLNLLHPPKHRQRILMTPSTEVNLRTNRDNLARMTYSIVDPQGCSRPDALTSSVSRDGRLSTGPSKGTAVLTVTSHEMFGEVNQTLSLLVNIKPISYVMLSLRKPGENGVQTPSQTYVTNSLPIGGPFPFTVSYHDDLGAKFDVANLKVDYRLNRFEYLQISMLASGGAHNTSLVMRVSDPGSTIVHLHAGALEDFVTIPTGFAISPSEVTVTNGDVICFKSPFSVSTSWLSSSSDILEVNGQTGVTIAKGVGNTFVRQEQRQFLDWATETTTRVSVEPATKLSLRAAASGDAQLISPLMAKAALFSIVTNTRAAVRNCEVSSHADDVFSKWSESLVADVFSCELELSGDATAVPLSRLFVVTTEMDRRLGPVCRVKPTGDADLLPLISASEMNLDVRVRMLASHGQNGLTSDVVSIPIVPGFHILFDGWPESQGITKPDRLVLVVNDQQPFLLRIVATKRTEKTGLRIESSHPNIVQILPSQTSSRNPNMLVFPIRAKSYLSSEVMPVISVEHSMTGQKHLIHVSLKPDPLSFPTSTSRSNPVDGLAALLMSPFFLYTIIIALCVVILINFCNHGGGRGRFETMPRPIEAPVPMKLSPTRLSGDGFMTARRLPSTTSPGVLNSSGSPQLWSRGYPFTEPAADFRPVSPYRRSPHSLSSSFSG